jgi:hypothetical protein
MMYRGLFLLGMSVLVLHMPALADEPVAALTPQVVIERSVTYHDPASVWENGSTRIGVQTTYSEAFAKRVGVDEATLTITMSPAHETFVYVKETATDRVEIALRGVSGEVQVNGSTTVSDEDRERLRLREPAMYRDYCQYLYGMPMKLRDPGAIFDPQVKRGDFNGREVLQLRVSYDPEVGKDLWYFYFDPESFALVGYRFYHDEAKNDGEYITFDGEIVDDASGLRLPKTRAWFYNADSNHLATDTITAVDTWAKP